MANLTVQIVAGSILDVEAQAIVNAANSHGTIGGGVAGVIRRIAGSIVEQDAIQQTPTPVGTAVPPPRDHCLPRHYSWACHVRTCYVNHS